MDACEELIALLGKPRPTNAQLFMNLIQGIDEKPILDYFHHRYCDYDFLKSGIRLQFDTELGIFDRLRFQVHRGYSDEHQSYAGRLPFEIGRNDSVEEVEAKIPGSTMQLKDYRFDLDLRPLVLNCVFSEANEPVFPQRYLRWITVDYLHVLCEPLRAASLGYDVRRT